MKNAKFIVIAGIIASLFFRVECQPYLIRGSIEHTDGGTIYLASFYGDSFVVSDSMESPSGSFHFMLSDDDAPGIYRIIFDEERNGVLAENRFVELIFNREDVWVNVTSGEMGPVPSFEGSLENSLYFAFIGHQLTYETGLMQVYALLHPADPGNRDYLSAVARYEDLQQRRIRFMDSITTVHPGLYATRIMNAFRAPVVPGNITHTRRIDTLKQIFFDLASIDDPSLLHAPVYTFRIVDYLSLYKVDTLSPAMQEDAFIEAVDMIMENVLPVQELRSFVVEFLLEGFELLGMESVQLHLADHYLDESCASDVAELVRSRMEGYRRMVTGTTAPDLLVRDQSGSVSRLSELDNPYVLVMFWASTCGHCRKMIPELRRWYHEENRLDLEVVAISIDSLESAYADYLREVDLPWINFHEKQGWNGKAAGDYHIYSTPSMFLLDNRQTILARPVHFRQFQKAVRKLHP